MTTQTKDLLACPFCGAGTTQVRVQKGTWNGHGYGEPVSVSVFHWCDPVPGQPSRAIERVGRDHEAAIEAWNIRASATSAPEQPRPPMQDETWGSTPKPVKPTCTWLESDPWGEMPNTYEASCGELWSFIDGGPVENSVKFCHGCGKPVIVEPFPPQPAEGET